MDQRIIRLETRACHLENGSLPGRSSREVIKLEIRDFGAGIPDSVRERIFDPFFSTKETGEGTGLGLYISHGIVTSHGGSITVHSREGDGTSFTITLPVAADEILESKL